MDPLMIGAGLGALAVIGLIVGSVAHGGVLGTGGVVVTILCVLGIFGLIHRYVGRPRRHESHETGSETNG